VKFPAKVRSLEGIDLQGKALHLAIGMFDGVHLGHQSVIEAAVHSARRQNGIAGVLTFWPHPSSLFRPEKPTRLIMDPVNKARLFRALGMDLVIEQPFDRTFAAIPASDFVARLTSRLPTLDSIYVGENWRFGQGRTGDVPFLVDQARRRGVSVISMPRLYRNGEAISSSRIRGCLERGELEEANSLLGYSYFVEAAVQPGRRLGRELGFPTLNLGWNGDLRPRFGVYGVQVTEAAAFQAAGPWSGRPDGKRYPGVANFGVRPTVAGDTAEPVLEVHLLGDHCPFGPRDRLCVEWLFFLRPEIKFDDLGALRKQLRKDCREAGSRLGAVK
jgi:riboflavin kinase / FMN adenylyltransferase